MSYDPIAIRLRDLGKCYQLYDAPHHRLKQFVLPRLQRAVRQSPRNYFREFWAVKGVSFDVARGETVGIVGRNGSGKSTLLEMIVGTCAPSCGVVEVSGRTAALLELGSGFNFDFTGRENVYLNGLVLGLREDEISSRIDNIVSFADIGQFFDQPVKKYSSGMFVRLAFAVAINVDPDILIVDEALSVGDEAFQRKCFARIRDIKENGGTILFVSHSGSTVVELCDRAVLMDAGEALTIGEPKKVVSLYQKLLYAAPEKVSTLRRQIRDGVVLEQDGSVVLNIDNKGTTELQQAERTAEFDPELVPKSTIRYESRGASIESPEIRTLGGHQVNILCKGDEYIYRYTVHFQRKAFNIRFGMLIKTLTGLELGGALSFPNGHALPEVKAGSVAEVLFKFRCLLTPGTYFLNAGVQGSADGFDGYLDRVIDAAMFRVQPEADLVSTALVDFEVLPTVTVRDPRVANA